MTSEMWWLKPLLNEIDCNIFIHSQKSKLVLFPKSSKPEISSSPMSLVILKSATISFTPHLPFSKNNYTFPYNQIDALIM